MSLRQKIFLGFAAIVMIGAAEGLYALAISTKLAQSVNMIFAKPLTSVESARAAWVDFKRVRNHVVGVQAMTEPVDAAASLQTFNALFDRFEKELAKLRSSALSESSTKSLAIIERASMTWRHRAMTLLGERPAREIAAPHLMRTLEHSISSELDHLVNATLADAAQLRGEIINQIDRSEVVGIAALAISLLLGSLLAIGAGLHIVRPLERLQGTMMRIASSDFETEIADTERSDEIGTMASTLEVFRTFAHERARADRELVTSRRRFKDIAESGSDWIWECDAELRFTYLSDSFERITGVPVDEMIGKTRQQVAGEADIDWEPHMADLRARRPFRDFRYSSINPDGERCYFSTSGKSVYDENGVFCGYRGTGSDRTASERQSAIVNLMSTVSHAANSSDDPQSTLEHCLGLICKFTNWDVGHVYKAARDGTGKLLPTAIWHLSDPERFAKFKAATAETTFDPGIGLTGQAFAQGQPFWKNFTKHDESFERAGVAAAAGLVGGAGFPIIVREKVVAVLEFFSTEQITPVDDLFDILRHVCAQISRVMEREQTEQALRDHRDELQTLVDAATADLKKKAEELRVALEGEKHLNAQQRQFVLMASHEFRTPLAIIDSTAQRLKRRAERDHLEGDYAAERTERIRESVQRMTRLIDSTLSAFRMQEGIIKIDVAPCDIGKLLKEACHRQQDIAANHNITCHVEDLPESIVADAGSLELTFSNLLSNAVKYAPTSPDIDVEAHSEGEHVVIAVSDQGIGIDKDEVTKIGERFFRAKTAAGIAGTGIGLNLVKTLIELHDGSFTCRSVKGKGSTFTLRLPVAGPKKNARRAA